MSKREQEVLSRVDKFKQESDSIRSLEIDSWLRADEMYMQQFDDEYDRSNLYNPSLMFDIVQRVVDDLKLADYVLRIPGSDDIERQISRDYITQVEQESGLTSLIRDDDKGALSWAYLGNVILWWGKADDDMVKKGIPIKFQVVRLTQAYFPRQASAIRDYNGDNIAEECLFVFKDDTDKVRDMFQDKDFTPGDLPFTTDYDVQDTELSELADEDQTERGYYYNATKGQFYIMVGPEKTVVEKYDDNDPSLPNYPFKLDGKNYLPCEHLRAFPTLGDFYAKGLYHKFAKIARNDANRRNLAHLYATDNVHPDRFIRMSDDRYSNFINDLSINRELIEAGERSYVQIGQDENIEIGDFRSAPLSNEFERMKQDDMSLVNQGGIAITDVDRPASESATQTAAEEVAKTRLADHIVKINAGSSMFIRKIIVDFIKKHIKSGNKGIVATNAKVSEESNEILVEKEVGTIKCSQVAQYFRDNDVFIQEDFSAWDNIGMKLKRIRAGLMLGQGLPLQAKLQRQALASLGFESMLPETQQINQPQNAQTGQSINIPQEQITL